MINENNYEDDRQRLSRLLMISRAQGLVSQEKMALEIGVAKKTIQNWERGVSSPSLIQAIAWFRVLDIAALPYLLQFIFPGLEGIKATDNDQKLKDALITLINSLPPEGIRQLLYVFYGDHGSSPEALLHMLTAHLQTPLRDRYSHAEQILTDYKLAKDTQNLTAASHIQPDTEVLEKAIACSREALLSNKNEYSRI